MERVLSPHIKTEPHAPSPTLVLNAVLDLKSAAPLVSTLLSHRGSDLSIDASNVRRLGGQCLQVLISAKNTWNADEVSLEFVNSSIEFIEALEGFGISADNFIDRELSQ